MDRFIKQKLGWLDAAVSWSLPDNPNSTSNNIFNNTSNNTEDEIACAAETGRGKLGPAKVI
jgi:hypothetical protein